VLRWLGSIEADFERLNPIPASSPLGGGTGAFGSKSPASDHVIAMLDRRSKANAVNRDDRDGAPLSVPAVIGEWCEVPWRDSEDILPGTVGQGFAYLRFRNDWLMQQDCAADFADEIRRLYVQLRGHAEPKRKIGECPAELVPGVRCEAPLRTGVDDDVIRCHACGSSWLRPWHDLRAALGGHTLMDYAMLSDWLQVKVGTLWRWCAEDGWVNHGEKRRALWAVVDVLASYQVRRAKVAS
jgi:hypothetical protein